MLRNSLSRAILLANVALALAACGSGPTAPKAATPKMSLITVVVHDTYCGAYTAFDLNAPLNYVYEGQTQALPNAELNAKPVSVTVSLCGLIAQPADNLPLSVTIDGNLNTRTSNQTALQIQDTKVMSQAWAVHYSGSDFIKDKEIPNGGLQKDASANGKIHADLLFPNGQLIMVQPRAVLTFVPKSYTETDIVSDGFNVTIGNLYGGSSTWHIGSTYITVYVTAMPDKINASVATTSAGSAARMIPDLFKVATRIK